jgi:peptide/nickel transport system ATP-binding protein
MTEAAFLVRTRNLARYFDVSPPFLNRVFEGKPRLTLKAVDGVDLEIGRGRTFALVGESGCGKSTVARMLAGLYRPTRGSIEFDGIEISRITSRRRLRPFRRRIQMIFQDPFASLNPRWRVMDIIAEPLRAFRILQGRATVEEQVVELLRQVGLGAMDRLNYPHEFSGGQRQRIAIARALASSPEFLICDEPTSALDVSVQAQILNLMKDLQDQLGLAYLLITHDLAVVHHVADRIGVMYLGRLCETADAESLFREPRHPYTRLLLDTVPDLTMSGKKRVPVAGEVPNPMYPPPGCVFHPRCPHTFERCRLQRPELKAVKGSMVACHAVEEGHPIDRHPPDGWPDSPMRVIDRLRPTMP